MAAGTLFGLGLSQQNDLNGHPMSGCKLYIFEVATQEAATVYRTTALDEDSVHPWPILADGNGRIPAFWLDSSLVYRARLTDDADVVQFDESGLIAIGTASEAAPPPAGGTGDPTNLEQIFQRGDVKWRPMLNAAKQPGWVRLNGKTIGETGSGASEETHQDASGHSLFPVYEFIWDNITFPSGGALCPLLTSAGGASTPGASALADWNALKRLTLPDTRGRALFGVDDMGNTGAGEFTGITFEGGVGSATQAGTRGGEARHTLTQAQLPNVSPTFTGTPTGALPTTHNALMRGDVVGGGSLQIGAGTVSAIVPANSITVNSFTPAGTISALGSSNPHPTISPFLLGTWYMKL